MAEANGRDFEARALALARAIFDPSGLQGSEMIDGRERDAVFVSDRSVEVFEFTQDRTKKKAEKDGAKLADLVEKYERDPAHRYKSKVGYFVTEEEPTADQRGVIDKIARSKGVPLKTMSISTLRNMLVDAEGYLRLRLEAPFGSTGFRFDGLSLGVDETNYVEPVIANSSGPRTVTELAEQVHKGRRVVITGDFGAGKSALLQQVFLRLRKKFFRDRIDGRLPIHINLRDCDGLRSATEVLRRHAEELGVDGTTGLIPAWRSGTTVLLLDGFDEIIPTRWVGSVRDLRALRWKALEAVRRLVEESPEGTGVLVAGRAQYFGDDTELLDALGIGPGEDINQLVDFDEERSAKLLGAEGVAIPDWLPSRPLLLRYLAASGIIERLADGGPEHDEATAWVKLMDLLAKREADRISSVDPGKVRDLLARIATQTRGADGAGQVGQGVISMRDMEQAFLEVCGYEPEEEGKQLLLRMPGLARAEEPGGQEMRTFVDSVLAQAAYGTDLAKYIEVPYGDHPLGARVSWAANTSDLPARVAASQLAAHQYPSGHVRQAIKARVEQQFSDSVMLDLMTVAELDGVSRGQSDVPYFRELLIANLRLASSTSFLAGSRFQDCLIETLSLDDVESIDQIPVFDRCLIDNIDGVSQLPTEWEDRFIDCDIENFTAVVETTAGLMAIERPIDDRIALTILKKVYAQSGAGRKASALSRGLPQRCVGTSPTC